MAVKYASPLKPISAKHEKALIETLTKTIAPESDTAESVERKMQSVKTFLKDAGVALHPADPAVELTKREAKKFKTSIRLDVDIYEWLVAGGPGWQAALNKALRAMMEQSK